MDGWVGYHTLVIGFLRAPSVPIIFGKELTSVKPWKSAKIQNLPFNIF